jgi:hypothetical protein
MINTHTQDGQYPQYDVGPDHRTILVTQRFGPDDHWSFAEEVADIQDFDSGSWTNAEIANALDHLETDGIYYETWETHSHEICYQLVTTPPTPYWL